jgi:hypothetical protein
MASWWGDNNAAAFGLVPRVIAAIHHLDDWTTAVLVCLFVITLSTSRTLKKLISKVKSS